VLTSSGLFGVIVSFLTPTPSIEASQVREMQAQGMRPSDIAKVLKIGRASVYRVLGQKADH
jgi:DNA invertase Pin-like site-specific DNA recombinase